MCPEPFPVLSNHHLTSQTAPLSPRPSVQWAPLTPSSGGEEKNDDGRRTTAANAALNSRSFSRGGCRADGQEDEEDEKGGGGGERRDGMRVSAYDSAEQGGGLTSRPPTAVRLGPDCYKVGLYDRAESTRILM